MLLYNYKHADLITHRSSSDRGNTGCVAVLSFAEPAPAQDFRQSPTSSADNFLQKQQKQRGGPWCRRRRDALPAPPGPLARGMARQQHRRTGPAIRCCARGRTARCRAGDGDKTTCYLQERSCCRFAVDGDIINHRLNSKMFPEKRRRARWRPMPWASGPRRCWQRVSATNEGRKVGAGALSAGHGSPREIVNARCRSCLGRSTCGSRAAGSARRSARSGDGAGRRGPGARHRASSGWQ